MTNPTTESLERQAIECAKQGDFGTDARQLNERLTELAPANEGAWTRLARCCLEMGQLDEATAALDAALLINPQNVIARSLHGEVSRRRSGPAPKAPARTRRSTRDSGTGAAEKPRARRSNTVALAGLGRAEFTALGELAPSSAADSLSGRLEPLLMALNDRPFASKVTEARNRAGQSGVRLFRRGTLRAAGPGHLDVFHQGGRWEPQLNLALYAARHWERDALSAGIGFDFSAGGDDELAGAQPERAFQYFEAFQRLVASSWRVHLTDWMRTQGGFVQLGRRPPAADLLPGDAVTALLEENAAGTHDWIFCGRWLFADRGEDAGILADASRLVRWIDTTFSDLLPLWGDVYRAGYRS